MTSVLRRPVCQPMDCIGTVVSTTWLTPTIKSIQLSLNQPSFKFLPGQSVWPKFEYNGRRFSKIYSIASSPSLCPVIELCVSRVGWSSSYLQDLAVGDSIAARGPYGLMTLEDLPTRPRLYMAEGSGIAPIKSQIDWLYELGFDQPVWLVQANPETPDQLPYESYWRSLLAQWPQFHYHPVFNNSPEQAFVADLNLSQFEIDICAVGDRVDHIYSALLMRGANPQRIRSEKFYAF